MTINHYLRIELWWTFAYFSDLLDIPDGLQA